AKTVRLPAGITVRVQPGILFVFTPERSSRSPRNPVRLAPESPTLPPYAENKHHHWLMAPSETLDRSGNS
ncbi:MAG: hypothetical protein ACR2NN_00060, partial [Bryobacteraceae bacterium]